MGIVLVRGWPVKSETAEYFSGLRDAVHDLHVSVVKVESERAVLRDLVYRIERVLSDDGEDYGRRAARVLSMIDRVRERNVSV